MGTQLTKSGQTVNEDEPVTASLPSTPIVTPRARVSDLDPRSPTANIVRTPIQVQGDLNKNQTPIIGEIATDVLDINTDNFLANIDPRSPSVDFIRTPIVIGKPDVILRNKNLDNVRKHMESEFSPIKRNSKNDENEKKEIPNKNIREPVLLESSPIVKKNEEKEKRKSYVGLLETNLDYIETDLDTVKKNEKQILDIDSKKEVDCVVENNVEPTIDEYNSYVTYVDINKLSINENETDNCTETGIITDIKTSEVNTEMPKIVETIEKIKQIDEEIKEVIEVTVDPSSNLDKTNISIIDEEIKNIITIKKPCNESRNPTSDFDKKITSLIYEDQDSSAVSVTKQNKPKDANRTPLKDHNRISHIKTKSNITKLRVHDKPKGDFTVSRIPVFKDKNVRSKKVAQCENTPPVCKVTESQLKKSQWDADKTLII